MQALRLQAIATVLMIVACTVWATERSHAARAEFQRVTPCPANDQRRGPCPGYIVDHIIPLCAGGPDHPENMQWQTVENAKSKDRDERRQCAGKKA